MELLHFCWEQSAVVGARSRKESLFRRRVNKELRLTRAGVKATGRE